MTWTVDNNLRNRLAGTGSLQASFTGGQLRILNASDTLLSSHTIGTVTVTANEVTVPFTSDTVEAGVSGQEATKAVIWASNDDLLLSTDNVGTTGADIPFNQTTGGNAGDTVDPGGATVTLTVGIAT